MADVGLATEDKQEARSAIGPVQTHDVGRVHEAWHRDTITGGVTERSVTQHHQETHRSVQDYLAIVRLLFQRILTFVFIFVLIFPFTLSFLLIFILIGSSFQFLSWLALVQIILVGALINFLEVGHFIIKVYKIDIPIQLQSLRVGDDITQIAEGRGRGGKVIGRAIPCGSSNPAEERNLVDWHLPGCIKPLLIRIDTTSMTETAPDGIFLGAGVNQALRLVDTGNRIDGIFKFQALRNIPPQRIVAGPVEGLDETRVHDDMSLALRSVLELVELAQYRCTESKHLGQRVEVEVANQLQPLRFQPFLS